MPNLANAFKDEIGRVSRKQMRPEIDALRKFTAAQRSEIAALKRRVHQLERAVAGLAKAQRAAAPKQATSAEPARRFRFSPDGLAKDRARLELSAADYGLLVGASGASIYGWEKGTTAPRPKNVAGIGELRGLGKRAVANRLAALKEAAS